MRPYQVNPEDPDQSLIRSMPKPVPLSSVRLIHALTDPETGITRDVIVKKLVNGNIYHDKHTGSARWSRIIPGLDIKIPWPKAPPKEYKDYPCDTLRLEVETQTFVPTLLGPPMPASIIDELRNKYSKFRTRHDAEYVAMKEQEDRQEQAKKYASKEMMTPLREINRRERKLRRAKGKGHLTAEMMQNIGQIIAAKRQSTLAAAGVSKESLAITV
jgi:large subunit ribosomal protein L24